VVHQALSPISGDSLVGILSNVLSLVLCKIKMKRIKEM
jgi:hypothetical protein